MKVLGAKMTLLMYGVDSMVTGSVYAKNSDDEIGGRTGLKDEVLKSQICIGVQAVLD